MARRVYLDWNATAPPCEDALDAMRDAAASSWANPQSVHAEGRRARDVVERAREAIAALVFADPRDVVLTSGGTEANNLAVRAAIAAAPREGPLPVVVTSRLEHPSIVRVVEALASEGQARARWVRVTAEGLLDLSDLGAALSGPVALVTAQAVNHETGVIQPLGEIAALCDARGARLHVDAVQALGRIDVPALARAATVAIASHKLRGPKGIGALASRPRVSLSPILAGGAQEKGLRPGTVDPVSAAGFGAAARRAERARAAYAEVAPLRDALERGLAGVAAITGLSLTRVGASAPRAPHVSCFALSGQRGAELVAALDLEGVAVSHGAACSAGTQEASAVVRAIAGEEIAGAAVRASLGETTARADIDAALEAIARVLARR